jgi:hypothetical protein
MIRVVVKYYPKQRKYDLDKGSSHSCAVTYDSEYDASICMGECIRSVCVNLGIDPDTVDGITRNIIIHRKTDIQGGVSVGSSSYFPYHYDPYRSLRREVKEQVNKVMKLKIYDTINF